MKEIFRIMRFIDRHRFIKKKKIYRLAFGVAFDWTIMIYTSVFALIFLFAIAAKFVQMQDAFYHYQQIIDPFLPFVLTAFIIKMILMSFRQPGVFYASAERKLSSLTYSVEKIWLYQFTKQIIKYVMIISAIFLFIFFLTPMTFTFLFKWYLLILSFQLFLLLPQWYFYQIKGWKKLFIYIGMVAFIGLFRLISLSVHESDWFMYTLLVVLILFNGWIWPRKLKHINWKAVAEQNEWKLWNMFFINKMSEMEIKPVRKQSFLQSLFSSEKVALPFSYQKPEVTLRKIWRMHISNEWNIIVMMFITVIISIGALSMQGPVEQGVGIALSIFLLERVVLSFFGVIFQEKLIYSIPWNMQALRKAFGYWVKWLSGILVVIIFIALLATNVSYSLVIIMFVGLALFLLLEIQLEYKIQQLNQSWYQKPILAQVMTWLTYLVVGFSIAYPYVISFSVIILLYLFGNRRFFDEERR